MRLSNASGVPQENLTKADKKILDQVAKAIREVNKLCVEVGTPPVVVLVEGHTNCKDPLKCSNDFNMRVSEDRATACREYVESAGTSESKHFQTFP